MTVEFEHEQIIASENQPVRWTTPLGLPVVQPYRKLGRHLVRVVICRNTHKINTIISFNVYKLKQAIACHFTFFFVKLGAD